MARNEQDPAASTQQFRAFASNGEAPRKGMSPALIMFLVTAAVIVVVAAAFILL